MWTNLPDAEVCERARQSRDARFDGRFFVAVLTTGIFCRPVCPARTPARENVRFYPSVATALDAGYRPCLRCRPERAPGAAPATRSASVQRALARIDAGVLDDTSVAALAREIGLSARQLTRQFVDEVGVAPGAYARVRRLAIAKQLIDGTALDFTRIAALSGFGSLRRFNEAIQQVWKRPPSALRKERAHAVRAAADAGAAPAVRLRVGVRAPYNAGWVLGYLRQRAVPGIEAVHGTVWSRAVPGGEVRVHVAADGLDVAIAGDLTRVRVADVLQRVRRLFDVAADSAVIDAHLGADARLAELVGAEPGLRVPGAWDPFELAVRAVLGQQVSVAGATTLAARLVQRFGGRSVVDAAPSSPDAALSFPDAALSFPDAALSFPDAAALAEADVAAIGMPEARGAAVRALARAVCAGDVRFDVGQAPEALAASLQALPGIGPWTAQYVAMRALGQPDAFPAEDIVLRKVVLPGHTLAPKALLARAEAWRPWRAYAVMYLWRDASLRRAAAPARAQRGEPARTTRA